MACEVGFRIALFASSRQKANGLPIRGGRIDMEARAIIPLFQIVKARIAGRVQAHT